jgi:hypothetical protein
MTTSHCRANRLQLIDLVPGSQNVMYGVDLPTKLKLSLVPVCVGVALATVNDFSFNLLGFLWATAGLVSTAFYQLLVKTRQDRLGVSQLTSGRFA